MILTSLGMALPLIWPMIVFSDVYSAFISPTTLLTCLFYIYIEVLVFRLLCNEFTNAN